MTRRAMIGFDPKIVHQVMGKLQSEYQSDKFAYESEIIQLSNENRALKEEIDRLQIELTSTWETEIARSLADAHFRQTKMVMAALQELRSAEGENEQLVDIKQEKQELVRLELLRKLHDLQAAEKPNRIEGD
jgi:hypothetical protein